MKEICLIGAGARGNAYGQYLLDNPKSAKFIAIVEPNVEKLKMAGEKFNVSNEYLFTSEEEFYKLGKIGDAAIIANHDIDHYNSVMKCIELGYDILLEKPITPSEKELNQIEAAAIKHNSRIMVCHVLRYTTFFSKIKEILDNGEIGDLVAIDHTEYIANHHMGHSYVRGHWRNSNTSSPIILAKSCHDLDLITWFANSRVKSVYSSGKLNYFNKKYRPEGAADRCFDCKYIETCIYSAKKFYYDEKEWVKNLVPNTSDEVVKAFLDTSNYGECIYNQDNNVCDHQVATFGFENGVDATFTLTAFGQNQGRSTRLFGTEGIVEASTYENTITVTKYICNDSGEQNIRVIKPQIVSGGHGGGDMLLMKDFINMLDDITYIPRTSLQQSLDSHKMSYQAENSRINNIKIDF